MCVYLYDYKYIRILCNSMVYCIYSASNAGRKIMIVPKTAKHSSFLPVLGAVLI